MINRHQSGFTLLELVVAVLVIGIVGIVIAPVMSSAITAKKGTYTEVQKATNSALSEALLNFAHGNPYSPLGQVPAPYTGAGTVNGIYNPADVSAAGLYLKGLLNDTSIDPSQLLDDNYASQRIRVYQVVPGLTQTYPLEFTAGPLVTLTYQYGVVYTTGCAKADSTCNPNPSTGIPGASPLLTAANIVTWTTVGKDSAAKKFSTLNLQQQMLRTTAFRLNRLRETLTGYVREKQRSAAASDGTNWFLPNPGTMGGANPATNQGCLDGWYDLTNDTLILPYLGLSAAEFGTTIWGGAIQYCRDYDATGTKAANAAPHYAAIRIHSSVSKGLAPDAVVTGNNLVLTF